MISNIIFHFLSNLYKIIESISKWKKILQISQSVKKKKKIKQKNPNICLWCQHHFSKFIYIRKENIRNQVYIKKQIKKKKKEKQDRLTYGSLYSRVLNRARCANRLPCSLNIRGRKTVRGLPYMHVRVRGPPIGVVVLLIFFALSRWIIESPPLVRAILLAHCARPSATQPTWNHAC